MSKIITASFETGQFSTAVKAFQWDVGDRLQFEGLDLPESYEVHFANSPGEVAIVRQGDADGVIIPTELMEAGTEVYAWVVFTDADGYYTEYQVLIPVHRRGMPADLIPSPGYIPDRSKSAIKEAVDSWLAEHRPEFSDGVPYAVKDALITLFEHVAYTDDQGETYLNNLKRAFALVKSLVSIEAVLDTGGAEITDSDTLGTLRQYLTVTATYDDGSIATVTDYTLSGTLEVGTSTIVVTYGTASDTVDVTVTGTKTLVSIGAVFDNGGATIYDTDTLDRLRQYLAVTVYYDDSSSREVTNYSLSGTLAEGTSTITVSYSGKTTTFNVTVTHSAVPSGYEAVDYVFSPAESESGPVIDTGVRLSGVGDATIEISFMDYSTANCYPIGCLASTTQNNIGFGVSVRNDSNRDLIAFTGGTPASISPDPLNNVRIDAVATVNASSISISDGTLSNTQTLTPRAYNVANLYLFGIKKATTNGVNYPFTGRIYHAKITENNVVLAEFIPCVRLSDYMAGFWDLVNETFIYANELVAAPFENDTTAQIEQFDVVLINENDEFTTIGSSGCGVTKLYSMDGGASSVLYPAGIIPARSVGTIRPQTKPASIVVYDENDNPITYVSIIDGYAFNRWAQDPSRTMTEFSQSWNVSPYSKIAFSIDMYYIHDAYMYDKTTGQVFFAGRNTPYYGMSNISEAGGN